MPELIPTRLIILDIDGLRRDVFHQALAGGHAPNLARIMGGEIAAHGLHLDALSPAPSITFTSQSTIFTGAWPDQHGITGNEFFDRFGLHNQGVPRFYAFDVGDALAVEDAVQVFSGAPGLLNLTLNQECQTLYERAASHGKVSMVVFNMLARGAAHWVRPSLLDIARFTKGGGLLGLSAEHYDEHMLDELIRHLGGGLRPDVLTAYFMGLDHHSHQHGPGSQPDYLERVVDMQVGRLLAELEALSMLEGALIVVVSDHGHIQVVPDDRHSLRLSFPFDREMAHVFDALGLDVNDYPGEGPNCNALVACNGGLAHVYLRRRGAGWGNIPDFARDVLPVADAFWRANLKGDYHHDLQDSLAMILVRDVEQAGWSKAQYQVYTPAGLQPVDIFLAEHPEIETDGAVERLAHLACPQSGDLLLVSNYAGGYYFGAPLTGTHGGLHPQDSQAVLSLAWMGAETSQVQALRQAAQVVIGERHATLADLVPVLGVIFGWD